ncbi:Os04g0329650 [Oryza sativa Japonica Group]|uniref:Os04g0329650 protein n=1 Tax=Oryza sativa subsp. japonica TaxID=39947 RepID=A0A0P0W8Y8_ORYSJ|nr:hypothetical protein EE612_023169 [Oryza sativa]BAS88611.1 Os04g0329650 [Oryza sativa Japonica Group]
MAITVRDNFINEVFALDVDTNPYGLTEIHSLNGGCKSFPAGLHHGVEGDHIYFVPDDWKPYDTFVYSMRDDMNTLGFGQMENLA